jgi:hypothetical protein
MEKKIGVNILLSFLLLLMTSCMGSFEAFRPVPTEKLQEVLLNMHDQVNMHDQERISTEIERQKNDR